VPRTLGFVLASALAASVSAADPGVLFEASSAEVDAFDFVEVAVRVEGPRAANPFREARVTGAFQREGGTPVEVEGFADAPDGSLYRIRFMPRVPGAYGFEVRYAHGGGWAVHRGTFIARDGKRRGLLAVDRAHRFHFVWEGTGEYYFWNGTTAYFLAGWDDETIRASLDRLARLKVNHVRVALSGRVKDAREWYEPVVPTPRFSFLLSPWAAARPQSVESPGFDVTRFNVEYWQKYERLLRHARERDVIVSVILYLDGGKGFADPFGRAREGSEDERRYFRYAAARLSAFSNLTWDLANEYRLLRSDAWPDTMGAFLKSVDPYRHLASVHGFEDFRFRASPWADFAMYQMWDECGGYWFMANNRLLQVAAGRAMPQVNEEYGYEDHYPPWGCGLNNPKTPPGRSADNRRRLAWEMSMAGGYQTTGERANQGTGVAPDTGGGWVNGRGDDSMVMLQGYARMVEFFTSFAWWTLEPHPEMVRHGQGHLCLAEPGQRYVVYLPSGGRATVTLDGRRYRARWYNPRSGEWGEAGLAAERTWVSPEASDRQDWALLIERAD
jgi:hypothetical protein